MERPTPQETVQLLQIIIVEEDEKIRVAENARGGKSSGNRCSRVSAGAGAGRTRCRASKGRWCIGVETNTRRDFAALTEGANLQAESVAKTEHKKERKS